MVVAKEPTGYNDYTARASRTTLVDGTGTPVVITSNVVALAAGGATEAKQDSQITLATTLNGYVDGLETLSAATNAKLDTLITVGVNGVTTSVASSATAVTLSAADSTRRGMTVFNDSTQVLYLLLGAGTASSTVYTNRVAVGAYYEVPFRFTGIVTGAWASANGFARITVVTP